MKLSHLFTLNVMIESYPQILEKPTVNFFNFTLSKVYQNYKVANLIKFQDKSYLSLDARMAELVDALDSKSSSREGVRVRPPLRVPLLNITFL